jgi:CPA1 family monovalent cation:H+ antiporter
MNVSYPIFLVIGLLIGLSSGRAANHTPTGYCFCSFYHPCCTRPHGSRPGIGFGGGGVQSFHSRWDWSSWTSLAVAVVSTALIPNFTMPLGFLLGGVISAPDAASAVSVLKSMAIPKRLETILEGESLVNDAEFDRPSLRPGRRPDRPFRSAERGGDFVLVVTMGILIGLAVALVFYCFHRFLPTTPASTCS